MLEKKSRWRGVTSPPSEKILRSGEVGSGGRELKVGRAGVDGRKVELNFDGVGVDGRRARFRTDGVRVEGRCREFCRRMPGVRGRGECRRRRRRRAQQSEFGQLY